MRDEVDKVIQRTQAYWFVDGLVEIASGFILALLALLFVMDGTAPPGSPLHAVSSLGLPLVIVIGALVAGRVVAAVKARITYPRTGYVAYRRERRHRWASALAGALVAAALAALAVALHLRFSLVLLGQGIVLGALLLYGGYALDLRRFYVLAAASVALGAAAAASALGETLGDALYFGLLGLAIMVSGAVTLRNYLRQAPPATAAGQEDHVA